MKGAWLQSVLTLPPCVAQSSAFHIELYTPMGWSFGYGNPCFSMLVWTRIGVSSTRNLSREKHIKMRNHQHQKLRDRLKKHWDFKNHYQKLRSLLIYSCLFRPIERKRWKKKKGRKRSLHNLARSPLDWVFMKALCGVEPEVQSLFSVAYTININIGLNQIGLSSGVAQKLKIKFIVSWSVWWHLHHKKGPSSSSKK